MSKSSFSISNMSIPLIFAIIVLAISGSIQYAAFVWLGGMALSLFMAVDFIPIFGPIIQYFAYKNYVVPYIFSWNILPENLHWAITWMANIDLVFGTLFNIIIILYVIKWILK